MNNHLNYDDKREAVENNIKVVEDMLKDLQKDYIQLTYHRLNRMDGIEAKEYEKEVGTLPTVHDNIHIKYNGYFLSFAFGFPALGTFFENTIKDYENWVEIFDFDNKFEGVERYDCKKELKERICEILTKVNN